MKNIFKTAILLLAISVLLCSCTYLSPLFSSSEISGQDGLQVEFLDVGQADCIFILLPNNETALIDGGNNADGPLIADYLRGRGVTRIDYLFATHPHEDHIGGLDDIVAAFDIGSIYMPKIAENDIPTTRTYEDLLDAISSKGYKATRATAGVSVINSGGLSLEILGPMEDDYSSLNEYSIVLRLSFNGRAFVFTGDAETDNEVEIRKSGCELTADVLKVGHHGSSSSTTKKFLAAVNPEYAVISCGAGNSYGHPHAETVSKLNAAGVETLRTDIDGTIIFSVPSNSSELNLRRAPDICLDGNR